MSRLRGFGWLSCLLAFVVHGEARADIYQCRRSDGSVLYTNKPSAGRCSLSVRSKGRRPAAHTSSRPTRLAGPPPPQTPYFTSSTSRSERFAQFTGHVRDAARLYQLPEPLIRAVMHVESGYNPHVVSRVGAMGLMQLMPRTATSMGVDDPFDPRQNILGGTRYLRILANRFRGDMILTLAAYNAGERAVEKHRGIPPYDETQRYVRNVLRRYYAYRNSPEADVQVEDEEPAP